MNLRLQKLDTKTISDADLKAYTNLVNLLRAEMLPDDPPLTPAYHRRTFEGLAEFTDFKQHYWLLWDGAEPVARAVAGLPLADNRHLLEPDIYVLPEYRRRGLAWSLLAEQVKLAKQEARSLLVFDSSSTVPAGEAFAGKLEARMGITNHTNQLVLADLDRSLLQTWCEEAALSAADFEIGLWPATYPEGELAAIAELMNVMNTEPRGSLEIEDFEATPQRLREDEAYLAKTGTEVWEYYVRHRPTGELAGFSTTAWQADMPTLVRQWGTAVKPKFRGHGLGKWLKAAMLLKVLAERPQVTLVRTGNADVNAPMLSINRRLGFKPYIAHTVWQVNVADVRPKLANPSRTFEHDEKGVKL